MAFSREWKTRQCHFTWNLESEKRVYKCEDKLLGKIKNNLEETPFLKIENLLFKACLQSWFKDRSVNALASLDEAKREIELQRNNDIYKGYKSVELLNRMWIEHKTVPGSESFRKLHEELEAIQLEEDDLRVVGAVKAAALMRLGPVMFDTNIALFKAAHQAFPLNPDFLFGVADVTGQKVRFMKPYPAPNHDSLDQSLKDMMDEEKVYWEKLIDLKPNHRGYHYAKSMLGWNLSLRDGPNDKKKASELLKEAYDDAPTLQEVCRNLIRMLRKTDNLDRAIFILKNAKQGRTENHHQLALCYKDKAKKEKQEKHKLNTKAYKDRRKRQKKADKWTIKALNELKECLKLDSSHFFALELKAAQLKYVQHLKGFEKPKDYYSKIIKLANEFMPTRKMRLYTAFAPYLGQKKSASEHHSRIDCWRAVMNLSTDVSFEKQNGISGKWETEKQAASYKKEAYEKLKEHYMYEDDRLNLGILFYQNFEFDQAIGMLATVGQTNAEVSYFVAKSYLKKGQEKTVGNQANPAEAAEDFTRVRKNVEFARESELEPQKVREMIADTALAIAHNELQANANDVIQLEDMCVTSYREAVRCGSLVAGLELMKLAKSDVIDISSSSRSKFIQMLAEIKVCCSQSQSDALHAASKPLTFEGGLRSKETAIEPCMLMNRTNVKDELKGILSKETFYQKAWKGLFKMEVKLLKERFRGTDGHGLDGREEASPLESVTDDVIDKAVSCCCDTRPLLDRIMEKFLKDELCIRKVEENYFPLILDEKLTAEITEERLLTKTLNICKIDLRTQYPRLYDYLLKLQPKISPENEFIKHFCTIVNNTKHSSGDVLDIEPNLVKLARQSTDKVEEICQVFFDTMNEAKVLMTRVEYLVSAIRQGGGKEVEKADELFELLMKNEDFVIRMDNTWKFLEMLTMIKHCRLEARRVDDVDFTRWAELSERNSEFSQDLRRGYLEVEAALLTNNGDQSSKEVLEECHKTSLEADKLLNKAWLSKVNGKTQNFPFLSDSKVKNKDSWKGDVKKKINDILKKQKIPPGRILNTLLKAQPCSSDDNYHFLAMRKFLDDWSRGTTKDTVSIEKGTNSTESYDVLDLTRWCVNHAEKLASEVMACMNQL
ncbi:uncharacterized protein [Asterias amurensis]|uniref:uncharacterized protein n=1 Tax=Asterias amurensis TaxID=7602 RepID=UPI003AB26FB7